MPANDWTDFWERMNATIENWKYHYFGKPHYYLFLLTLISSLIYVVYMRFKNKDVKPEQNRKRLSLWIFLCVVFFGYFLFTIAMAKQFKNHDYYFIDTYFLPILLLFCMIFNCLPKVDNYKLGMLYCLISAFFIVIMLKDVNNMQSQRRRLYWGKDSERTINNYRDSEQFLDSIGVSKDAKILSLYSYPQSTPFILMNRKGFIKVNDKVENELSFDYDYVIIESEIYEVKQKENQDFLSTLTFLADNKKLMVFVKN